MNQHWSKYIDFRIKRSQFHSITQSKDNNSRRFLIKSYKTKNSHFFKSYNKNKNKSTIWQMTIETCISKMNERNNNSQICKRLSLICKLS